MAASPTDLLADALEARNAEAAAALRDGRRMRAERGRAAVLTAAYELVNTGENPTIAMIAERAGVSERTVFRYYPDREALMVGIAGELFPIVQPNLTAAVPTGDFDERVRELLRLRIELVQIGGAFATVVDRIARTSDLARNLRTVRDEMLRVQTREFLSPECHGANAVMLPVIDSLLDHTTIAALLDHSTTDEVAEVLRLAVRRLLET